MGCGCKNKTNEQNVKTQSTQNTTSVKQAVQKIVEKYYSKK